MFCDSCGFDSAVYTRRRGKTICRMCRSSVVRPSVYDPFSSLTLDHVRDQQDRPVTVTSLRQLRQIEKEHRCLSAVANLDDKHVDEPPQHKPNSAFDEMTRQGKWLYPEVAMSMMKEMQEAGELV